MFDSYENLLYGNYEKRKYVYTYQRNIDDFRDNGSLFESRRELSAVVF